MGLDKDDLLWQARNLDLAGRYDEAESLRRLWIETNMRWCPACRIWVSWSHDVDECVEKTLSDVIDS